MKRTVSYIARNERKYADRRIKQLRQDMKKATKRDSLAIRREIYNINKLKKATYIKKRTPAGRAKAMEAVLKLRGATRLVKNTAQARQNKIIKRELNIASKGIKKTFLGKPKQGQAYTKIFYQATRNLWQGVNPRYRNEAILLGLGEKSLKKAVTKVLAQNRGAIRFSNKVRGASFAKGDNWFFRQNFHFYESSPEYLDVVQEVDNINTEQQNNNATPSVDLPYGVKKKLIEAAKDALNDAEDVDEFLSNFSDNVDTMLTDYAAQFEAMGENVSDILESISTAFSGIADAAKNAADFVLGPNTEFALESGIEDLGEELASGDMEAVLGEIGEVIESII